MTFRMKHELSVKHRSRAVGTGHQLQAVQARADGTRPAPDMSSTEAGFAIAFITEIIKL